MNRPRNDGQALESNLTETTIASDPAIRQIDSLVRFVVCFSLLCSSLLHSGTYSPLLSGTFYNGIREIDSLIRFDQIRCMLVFALLFAAAFGHIFAVAFGHIFRFDS